MKRIFVGLVLVALCGAMASVSADPIQDLSMQPYKAGWYPNFFRGAGPLSCPDTCKLWTGSKREHEQSRDIDGQSAEASVCKITRDKTIITTPINAPASHWIYGNQFDNWAMCHVQSLGYGEVRSEYYMCLCVQ